MSEADRDTVEVLEERECCLEHCIILVRLQYYKVNFYIYMISKQRTVQGNSCVPCGVYFLHNPSKVPVNINFAHIKILLPDSSSVSGTIYEGDGFSSNVCYFLSIHILLPLQYLLLHSSFISLTTMLFPRVMPSL